jgi:hypothetical protein
MHRIVCIIGAFCFLLRCPLLFSQTASDTLWGVSHSASLTFTKRDLACVEGPISKADVHTVTIQPYKKPPIVIPREDLLQVSQGDALLFSAISSWNDVMATHVVKHEGFVIRTRSGNAVSGRPLLVTKDAITLRHGLTSTTYQKAEILSVDYLRVRPPTDSWGYFETESPELLFFLPETYYRLMGFEGTVRVRLFDASKPETTGPVQCLTR